MCRMMDVIVCRMLKSVRDRLFYVQGGKQREMDIYMQFQMGANVSASESPQQGERYDTANPGIG